ncbi:MAG TPA: hypothetical protein VEK38_00205, partial [Candidatus Bathyarchaeia archaeon]|nr:hypothetical protein [Candidatus Bathyarchaeia archaeon]
MPPSSTGDILKAAKVATEEQIKTCQDAIQTSGQSLEQCLIETCNIDAGAVAKAYAEYTSLPYVEAIVDTMADLNIMAKVPFKFLRDNCVIPLVIDGTATILTANPFNFQPLDDINLLLGGGTHYAVATATVIMNGINRYYPLEGTKQMIEELEEEEKAQEVAFEEIEEKDIMGMETEAPIIKLVNHILFQAVKRAASDIHIEPFEK